MTFKRSTSPQVSRKAAVAIGRAAVLEQLEPRQLLAAWSPQDQIIGLDKATQNYPSINGAGETVVLIDRGVDYNHPALGNGFGKKVVDSYNFDNNSWDAMPYDGYDAHGTGSAGEVAADPHYVNGLLYQGVAPGVKLIALKAQGSWEEKQAFDWVIAHRSQYNIVGVNWVDPTGSTDPSTFFSELQTLKSQGVFVGSPSGNYGPNPAYNVPNHYYFQAGSSTLYGGISTFTPRGSAIDLVAPADNIDVTWYYSGIHADLPSNGTSWAGPQMVGAAALVKQVNPNFTPDQIMKILQDSATPIYDSYSGLNYAQLNVNAAIGLAYQQSGQSAYTGTPVTPVAPAPVVTAPAPVTPAAPANTSSAPFKGVAFSTGTTIQAGFYDIGGEGVSYHKTTTYNESNKSDFRPGDTVGITWTTSQGGSSTMGWTHAGEWENYTISTPASGSYSLTARVANQGFGATFHIEIDGKNVTGSMTMPDTGSWDNYVPVTKSGVWITGGQHVMKIVTDTNGQSGYAGNFVNFVVNSDSGATAPVATTPAPAPVPTVPAGSAPDSPYALSVFAGSNSRNTLAFFDNSTNESGFVVERSNFSGGGYSAITTLNSDANASASKGWKFFTDTGLSSGTTYYYRVKAINAAGSSSYTLAFATAT